MALVIYLMGILGWLLEADSDEPLWLRVLAALYWPMFLGAFIYRKGKSVA
jgi:hypothetical protein